MRSSTLTRSLALALAVVAVAALAAGPAAADRPQVWAVTGATVIVQPGSSVTDATVVIRDGLIEAVGAEAEVPPDAVEIDGEGLTVYAGWIDAYSDVGLPRRQEGDGGNFIQSLMRQMQQAQQPERGTDHPLELVHPGYSVTEELAGGGKPMERLREHGFTSAYVVPRDGIYRGTGAVITLRDADPAELVVQAPVAQHVAYESGGFLSGGYPSSLMGAIVTIRQVLLDARRHATWRDRYEADPAGLRRPSFVDAYPAMQPVIDGEVPLLFLNPDTRSMERSLELAAEFQVDAILLGNGHEYEVVDLLREASAPVIVPVDFPEDPEVEEPDDALEVSLEELRHWERAPGNAAVLEEAGIPFAFTTRGLDNPRRFKENVGAAIEAGLSPDVALAAVTTRPAEILGVDAVLGTVESGKIANLVVATGDPFAEETEIRYVFVDGHHHELEAEEQVGDPDAEVDPTGTWEVTTRIGPMTRNSTWIIRGEPGSYSGTAENDEGSFDFESVTLEGNALTVVTQGPQSLEITVVIEGDEFEGTVELPNGMTGTIEGTRVSGPEGAGARIAAGDER